MSAISLKSITGITSITTPAGVDNQLTLHNNNTTEAVKLDIAGNLHFHNHLNITGVSTASNFKTGTSNLHNTGLNVQALVADDLIVTGTSVVADLKSTNNNYVLGLAGNNSSVKSYFGTDSSGNFLLATGSGVDERLRIATNGKITHTNFGGVGFTMSGTGDPTFQISDADGTNQYVQLAHNGGDSYIVTRNNTSHGEFLVYSQNGSESLPRIKIGSDGTWSKYLNNSSTVQAAFGGTGQVNGITGLPSMAGSPLVVGRDTGSLRSASFGGNLNFATGYGIQGTEFEVKGTTDGLYLNSNVSGDAIIFQTHNGSSVGERIRITSGGSLDMTGGGGIIINEDSKLFLEGDTDDDFNALFRKSSENTTILTARYNIANIIDSNNDDTASYWSVRHNGVTLNGSSELMRVQSNGRVGINQVSPQAMLQVDYDYNSSEVGLRLRAATGSGTKTWQLSEINGNAGVFQIRNTSNGYSILNIDGANQRVGINKTNPEQELHIVGDSDACVRLTCTDGGVASFQLGDASDTVIGGLTLNAADNSIQLRGNNNSERVRIDTDGNVSTKASNLDHFVHKTVQATAQNGNYVQYILICPTGTNDVRLLGKFYFTRATGTSGNAQQTVEAQLMTNNTGGDAQYYVRTASTDQGAYAGMYYRWVTITYNSTNYYALEGHPITGSSYWGGFMQHGVFEGTANACSNLGTVLNTGNHSITNITALTTRKAHERWYNTNLNVQNGALYVKQDSGLNGGYFAPTYYDVNGSALPTQMKVHGQKAVCIDCTRYYTSGDIITFRINNDYEGAIYVNPSGVQYNSTSDYRLKENVIELTGAIDRVKQLKPKRFNFIKDPGNTMDGFMAHEVSSVVPNAVVGEKDAVKDILYEENDEVIPEGKKIGDVKEKDAIDPQSMDDSKLVPLLTAALQEAIAKIETLETKVAALEGS